MNPVQHLYVHIPFCPSICPYCSFHVLRANKTQAERFLENLIAEYRSIADQLDVTTIFLGGGTPTALSNEMLQKLLGPIVGFDPQPLPLATRGYDGALWSSRKGEKKRRGPREVSIECNPSTLSTSKASTLLCLGVNRFSIGAQSFDPATLRTLGRAHSVAAIRQCVATARKAGCANINLDLIFGVPGQSLASWKATLSAALDLQPQHLSCYALTYEAETEFFLRHRRGELRDNPPLEAEMFDLADEFLTSAGYHHYETSNYALPDFECRHNLAYWRGEDYHGIGPSAVSTVRGERRRNSRTHPQGSWSVEEIEHLSSQTLAGERMALGLRTSEGIEENSFAAKFGFSPSERWSNEINFLRNANLLIETRKAKGERRNGEAQARIPSPQADIHLRLSNRGRAVADEIATYFV